MGKEKDKSNQKKSSDDHSDDSKRKEDIEIDFDTKIGGVFGKLVEGLGSLSEKIEKAGGQIHKEGKFDFDSAGSEKKGAWGFSVRNASNPKSSSKPDVNPFKTAQKKQEDSFKHDSVRDPLVDIFEQENKIIVAIELPGVSKNEIEWEITGNQLKLHTKGKVKYNKTIDLPDNIVSDSSKQSYNNGILQITIKQE